MKYKRLAALGAGLALLLSCAGSVGAEIPEAEKPLKDRFSGGTADYGESEEQESYGEYAARFERESAGKDSLVLSCRQAEGENMPEPSEAGGEDGILWREDTAAVEWRFAIQDAGLYSLTLRYRYDGSNAGRSNAQRRFLLDGAQPFEEAGVLEFPHRWRDEERTQVNSLGDDVRPTAYELYEWQDKAFQDSLGLYEGPYALYLEAGEHTVRLEYIHEDLLFGRLLVEPAKTPPSYEEYIRRYDQPSAAWNQLIQAEDAVCYKSDTTLTMNSDGNPSTVPAGITNRRLNTLGGWGWRKGGQAVAWEFTVPRDGWYQLGVRFYQAWGDGLSSYRQIALDGEVPFREWACYQFDYSGDWHLELFHDRESGEPQYVFLGEGKHTLTLTVNLSAVTDLIQSIYDDTQTLSGMIQDITRLTGSDPDAHYDYDFFERIPDLKTRMEALADSLRWKTQRLRAGQGTLSAMAGNFQSMVKQLETMIRDPYRIAANYADLTDAQTNLGTYYQSLQESPLQIDYIRVSEAGASWADHREAGFFQKLWATLQNFVGSFFKDYDNMGSVLSGDVAVTDTITVWIARGTEWAEIIKEMTDERFTPQSGVEVCINVVPASQLAAGGTNALMLAIAAGNAPDVALGTDSNSPVEFAIRDAVVDVSRFPDYEETASRFLPEILVPYQYKGGVFAVPETMNYTVLFYRRDVLRSLSLALPDTWEDLYTYTLPTLYQNGYEFYYPAPNLSSFAALTPFLYQAGGAFYSADGRSSALGTAQAMAGFKEFCELFTNYAVPISANFFNRFRTGVMPIGVGDHNMYILLSTSAPELAGQWDIAPLPGTRRADGTVDRSHGGLSGTCSMIFTQSQKQQAAWEYLKWWMEKDVQVAFARELEALIGIEARWNTANIQAFHDLPWDREHLETIQSQWEWVREAPMVLGGYFTTRYVNNAWNSTAVGGMHYRDALENAVEEIDKEMRIKQEEYREAG